VRQERFAPEVEEAFPVHVNQAAAGARQDSTQLFAHRRQRVFVEAGAAAWYQVDNLLRPAEMRGHDVAVRLVENLSQVILNLFNIAKKPLVPGFLPFHDDRWVHRT
jgi:hypothetical protein